MLFHGPTAVPPFRGPSETGARGRAPLFNAAFNPQICRKSRKSIVSREELLSKCARCNYDLQGSQSDVCPKCGLPCTATQLEWLWLVDEGEAPRNG